MSQNIIDIVAKLQVQGLDAAAQQINATLGNRKVNVGVNIPTAGIQQLQSLNSSLVSLNATLQKINAGSRATTYSLNQLSPAATTASAGLQLLSNQGRVARTTMGSLSASLNQGSEALNSFGFQAGLSLRRFTAFTLAAGSMIRLTQGFSEGIRQGIDFQHQMVRVAQVSGDSSARIKELAQRIGEISVGFGVSSRDVTQAAVVFKQAGLSIKDTEIALNALAKAAVAPNFDSMAQTAEGAIAVMAQFKVGAEGLEGALGSMNAVAGEFAVEASDLITLVQKTGGAFKTAGGDLNELLGLFTAVRATTRESADQIATGLRTIFGRLQRNEVVQSLKEMQIELRHTAEEAEALGDPKLVNQFVGPFEAFRRLSQGLANTPTTDPKYAAIVEQIGGSRQLSRVIPAIQEFATAQKALQVAQAGTVSLSLAQEKAEGSLQLRITQSKEKFLELFRTITSDKSFDTLLRLTLSMTDAITDLVGALKPLIPLLGGVAAASFMKGVSGGVAGYFAKGALQGGHHKMASGGMVPGVGDGDTVPAMLTPGEFVFTKQAVRNIGVDRLRELENRGRSGGSVRLRGYANGGLVQKFAGGGEVKSSDFTKQFLSLSNPEAQHAFLFGGNGQGLHPEVEKILDSITKKAKANQDDAKQDALLRLLQKSSSGDLGFDASKGNLEAFLTTIAKSANSNQNRSNRGNRANAKVSTIGEIDGLMNLINQLQAGEDIGDSADAKLAKQIAKAGKGIALTASTKIQTKKNKDGSRRFHDFDNLFASSLTNNEGGDIEVASNASYGRDPYEILVAKEEEAIKKAKVAGLIASAPKGKESAVVADLLGKTPQAIGNTKMMKEGVKGETELAAMIQDTRELLELNSNLKPVEPSTNARAKMESSGGGLRARLAAKKAAQPEVNTGNGHELSPGLVEGRQPALTQVPDVEFDVAKLPYNVQTDELAKMRASSRTYPLARVREKRYGRPQTGITSLRVDSASRTFDGQFGFTNYGVQDDQTYGDLNVGSGPYVNPRQALLDKVVGIVRGGGLKGYASEKNLDTLQRVSEGLKSQGYFDEAEHVDAQIAKFTARKNRREQNARKQAQTQPQPSKSNGVGGSGGGSPPKPPTSAPGADAPEPQDSGDPNGSFTQSPPKKPKRPSRYDLDTSEFQIYGPFPTPEIRASNEQRRRSEEIRGLPKQGINDILGNRIEGQILADIAAKGGRSVLSNQTQREISDAAARQQQSSTLKELIAAEERLIKATNPAVSATEAHKIASENASKALATNAKVVTDANGAIYGTQQSLRRAGVANPTYIPTAGQYSSPFLSRLGISTGSNSRFARYSAFLNSPSGQTAQFAALAAAPIIADQASKIGGTAEQAAISGNGFGYKAGQGLSSAVSLGATGAFLGAQVGTAFGGVGAGPGAVIGLTVGALTGLVTALQSAEQDIKKIKFNDTVASSLSSITSLAAVKGPITSSAANEALESIRRTRTESTETNKKDSTGVLGLFDSAGFAARQSRSSREDFGASLPQLVATIANQAEEIGRANVGGKVSDLAKVLANGNNGLNREMLQIIASIRGVSIGTVLKEFEKNIKAAQDSKKISDRAKTSGFAEADSIAVFGRLALSAQAAADAMKKFSLQAETALDVFHGRVGSSHVDLNADNLSQFGRNDGGVLRTLGTIRSIGGEQGEKLFKHGSALDAVANILPGVLGNVAASGKDGDDAADAIRGQLTSSLGFKTGEVPKEYQDVIHQLMSQFDSQTRGETGAFGKKVENDSTGFAKDLLQPQTSAIQQSGKVILDAAQANLNTYIDRLTQSSGLKSEIRQTAYQRDVAGTQLLTTRNQFAADNRGEGNYAIRSLSLKQLEEAQSGRLSRLGVMGEDSQDPARVGARLRSANERVAELQKLQQSQAETDPKGAAATALELNKVKDEASKLQEALKLLADGSNNAAAAQQKLASLQQERSARLGAAANFYTASPQERAEITRDASLVKGVAGRGTLDGLSAQNQSRIVSFLQRNQGITLGKDKDGNSITTDGLLEKLLKNSKGGGFLNQGQEGAIKSLQNDIVGKFDAAEKAIAELVKTQESQQDKFFTLLSQAHEAFYTRLAGSLAKDTLEDKKRELGRKQVEESNLTKTVTGAARLADYGINDNNLRNVASEGFLQQFSKFRDATSGFEELRKKRVDANNLVSSSKVDFSNTLRSYDKGEMGVSIVANAQKDAAKFLESSQLELDEKQRGSVAEKFGKEFEYRLGDGEFAGEDPGKIQEKLKAMLARIVDEAIDGQLTDGGKYKTNEKGELNSESNNLMTKRQEALKSLGAFEGVDTNRLARDNTSQLTNLENTIKSIQSTGKTVFELRSDLESLRSSISGLKKEIESGSQTTPPIETTSLTPGGVSTPVSDRPLNIARPDVGNVLNARFGEQPSGVIRELPMGEFSQHAVINAGVLAERARKARILARGGRPVDDEELGPDATDRERKFNEMRKAALDAASANTNRTPEESLARLRATDGTGTVDGRTRTSIREGQRRLKKRQDALALAQAKRDAKKMGSKTPSVNDDDNAIISKYDNINRGDFNVAGALSRTEDPYAAFNAGRPDFDTQKNISGRQLSLIQQYNRQQQDQDSKLQDARNRRSKDKYKLPLQSESGPAQGAGQAFFSVPPESVAGNTSLVNPRQSLQTPQNNKQDQIGGLSQAELAGLTNGFATFGNNVRILSDSFAKFSTSAEVLAEAIGKMPSTLKVTGTQEVVVHHVGADALATMEPVFKEWIATGATEAVARAFKERLPDAAPPSV